jgi:hypothetical protein
LPTKNINYFAIDVQTILQPGDDNGYNRSCKKSTPKASCPDAAPPCRSVSQGGPVLRPTGCKNDRVGQIIGPFTAPSTKSGARVLDIVIGARQSGNRNRLVPFAKMLPLISLDIFVPSKFAARANPAIFRKSRQTK